jgi:hypothetical protein
MLGEGRELIDQHWGYTVPWQSMYLNMYKSLLPSPAPKKKKKKQESFLHQSSYYNDILLFLPSPSQDVETFPKMYLLLNDRFLKLSPTDNITYCIVFGCKSGRAGSKA